jgi:hypothetical protein
MYRKDRVLYAKVIGPMRFEVLKEYFLTIRTHLSDLGDNWGSIVDFSEWQLHVPEVIDEVKQFHAWLSQNGHRVEVCVTGGSNLTMMARKSLLDKAEAIIDVLYVDTAEQAWEWMDQNGYLDKV